MSQAQISSEIFFKRHHILLEKWKQEAKFDNISGIVIMNGKDDGVVKPKTQAINMWYLGYDFIDTILALTKKSIIIIASNKKFKYLEHFQQLNEFKEHNMTFILKSNDKNIDQLNQMLDIIKKDNDQQEIIIGDVNEKHTGPFAEEYQKFLQDQKLKVVDVSEVISSSLTIKDNKEIEQISKAAKMSVYFTEKTVSQIENILDQEMKVSHSEISKRILNLLEDEKEMTKLEKKFSIEKNLVEFGYSPIIQSPSSEFNLKEGCKNSNTLLKSGSVLIDICLKNSYYHSYIARTLLISPTNDEKTLYEAANQLQDEIIAQLKPGKQLNAVYEQGIKFLKEKLPNLKEDQYPTSFGYSIGLEESDPFFQINSTCQRSVEENMCFNVQIPLEKLSDQSNRYAIWISDTVIVKKEKNQIETEGLSRKYEDISYKMSENSEEEQSQQPNQSKQKKQNASAEDNQDQSQQRKYNTRYSKKNKNNEEKMDQMANEQKRKAHQLELYKQKLKEYQDRFDKNQFSKGKKISNSFELEKLTGYANEREFPKEVKKNQIYIDSQKDMLLLPINGKHLPIHISILKNVSKIDEGKTISIRLNFYYPGPQTQQANIAFPKLEKQTLFIKELTFRSKNANKINELIKTIKEVQKKVKQINQDRKNQEQLIDPEKEKLDINKGKRPVLKDVKIRPNLSQKKTQGILECHNNGLRYLSNNGEAVEVIFKNIKHAIFQPCDHEMIVCLHMHLFQPMIIGKKKTQDVQFFTEAGLPPEDLAQKRRGRDMDEYEEEQLEKAQKKRLNKEYEAFAKAVEDTSKNTISFQQPVRKLGFIGNPNKSNCLLQPTPKCLINVVETPFFVLTLNEVDIACFERMLPRQVRNFDLAFINKDYDKPAQRISAIPMEKADQIKEWLDKMDIYYYESQQSFNWQNLLQTIKTAPEDFIQMGAWKGVLNNGMDDEENNEENDEDDPQYELDSEDQEQLQEDEASDLSNEEYKENEQDDDNDDDDDDEDFDEEEDFDEDEEEEEEDFDEDEDESDYSRKKRAKAGKKNNRR